MSNQVSSSHPVPRLRVRRLTPGIPLPVRAHSDDAGLDLHSAEDMRIAPGERALVRTGIAIALPTGTVGLVHPRSGLAAKHGLSIVNAPGTIDAGYRGELMVNLINLDRETPIEITRGMRIAQLIIQEVILAEVEEVEDWDEPDTERGVSGYGSTGTH